MFPMLTLLTISVAMAILLYADQIAYMAVFALFGVIIATYVWLMARLLNRRLSGRLFQLNWALALAGSLMAEGWARAHGGLTEKGLLPATVTVVDQWKNRDVVAAPKAASSQAPHAESVALPPTHESIIDNTSVRKDLTALLVAELCNNADFVRVRASIAGPKVLVPLTLINPSDIGESAENLRMAQKDQAVLIDIADDQLQNYRLALDKGKGILAALSGTNASLAMRKFTEGQETLISNSERWKSAIVPLYQSTAEVMTLALKVKSQRAISKDTRKEWSELAPRMGENRDIDETFNAQAAGETNARSVLGKLIGETLPDDPH